jgi:hypothetical protein
MAKINLGPSYCPDCYLFDGMDVELPAPRAGATYKCGRGHAWMDIGDLQNRQDLARSKRQQLAPKDPATEEAAQTVPLAASPTGKEVVIREGDHDRIAKLLGGEFSDGASLFGGIYAIVQDLKAVQDELAIARKVPEPGVVDALNPQLRAGMEVMASGDLPVTILVPEQFVIPLKDICDANDTSIPDYMNAVIANGFTGNWFF